MTEQLPKDTLTTLADLKAKIDAIPPIPELTLDDDVFDRELAVRRSRERDAWRAAFEWRDGPEHAGPRSSEYHEGMRLIREKLQS